MNTRQIFALALGLVLFSFVSIRAADGEKKRERPAGGPVQNILDHAKELNLTDDQKTKLEALAKATPAREPGAMREQMKEHPELRDTMKEMKAARESGDQAKVKELRAKIQTTIGAEPAKDGTKPAEARAEAAAKIATILTPEQMKKLKELRESGAMGPAAKGPGAPAENKNKPDASKGVPDPFDK